MITKTLKERIEGFSEYFIAKQKEGYYKDYIKDIKPLDMNIRSLKNGTILKEGKSYQHDDNIVKITAIGQEHVLGAYKNGKGKEFVIIQSLDWMPYVEPVKQLGMMKPYFVKLNKKDEIGQIYYGSSINEVVRVLKRGGAEYCTAYTMLEAKKLGLKL